MNITRIVSLLLASCALLAPAAYGERIAKAELGNLQLSFDEVVPVSERAGATVLLETTTLPGDGFLLRLPFRPNRISRLVPQGSAVAAGTPVARLAGPELGIWLAQADALMERFAEARERYETNRPLYRQQALSAARWSEIATEYLSLQAQALHTEHVLETLQRAGGEPPAAELRAPVAGRIRFEAPTVDGTEDWAVATLIADDALRLVGQVSSEAEGDIVAVQVEDCRIALAHLEMQAAGLYRRLWTQPAANCVAVYPGSLVAGRVLHAFDGATVPRQAVLRAAGRAGVFLDDGDALEFVPVRVEGESPDSFFIEAPRDLAGRRVLTRSVSALQGLVLGLGTD